MLKPLTLQETVPISPTNPDAVLEVYARPDGEKRPAMLVFPGGGFLYLADVEAEPICRYYDAHGYQTFLVRYSVGEPAKYPAMLQEVSRAVWHIRSHADSYGVDPDKLVLCGFSAGAHLITMFATHYHLPICREHTDVPEGGNVIRATVTGYTPTTFERLESHVRKYFAPESQAKWLEDLKNHKAGGWILLDETCSEFSDLPALTCHEMVSEKTPPAFLWQTTKDMPESACEYAMALRQFNVPYELHFFTDPQRNVSMNFDPELYAEPIKVEPNTARWPEMSVHWLEQIFAME